MALILAVIYTLIIMVPLASHVMNSKTVALAVAGECSGDCRTCGCSAESMATGTCCCMKKQQQAHAHEYGHDGSPDSDQKTTERKQTVISSCGCTSGSGEHAALSGSGISDLLPCYFSAQFGITGTDTRFPALTRRMTPFQDAPPDPPPKISFCS
jgi:hypothetical protein